MTEIDYDALTSDDVIEHYETPAHTLEDGDQIKVNGELFVNTVIDTDRLDPDEVGIKGENLSGGEDEIVLNADMLVTVWSI